MIQITLSRRFLVALAACAVFALGCAARPPIIPPANAEQAGQTWEHMCFEASDVELLQNIANRAGAKGFEMVAGSGSATGMRGHDFWCMKRQK